MVTPRQLFWIVVSCIVLSTGITVYIFASAKADPGLRYAALLGASNIATAMLAIASTLLTGKDLTNRKDANDYPPGSVVSSSEQVATPPVNPQAIAQK